MSLLSDALDRLRQYNLNPFKIDSNPFGLTGTGGTDTNLEPMLGDIVTASEATADLADDAATAAQATAADRQAVATDKLAVHADRVAADADAQATAEDRLAVAQDRTAVEGSASTASTSATLAGQYAAAAGGSIPSVRLNWDTATADADPGNGKVRLNNAMPTAATALYVDNLDVAGASITTVLDRWTASTNTVKGTLRIAHRTDATKWLEYQVTGTVVDGTGYRKITVTGGTGPGGFAAGDPVAVGLSRSGDMPTSFSAGTAAAPGWAVTGDSNTGVAQVGGADTISLVAAGAEAIRVSGTATAVNYINVAGATAANAPFIQFTGSDANVGGAFYTKGTGWITFFPGGAPALALPSVANSVNHVSVSGAVAGNYPVIAAVGQDTNLGIYFNTKGTGTHAFATGGLVQAAVLHTPAANRNLTFTGSNGGNPTIGTSAGALNLTSAAGEVLINGNPISGSLTSVPQTGNATLVKGQSFIANSATALTFPLPTTAAVGDRFEVVGFGTGGWKISQNAGQYITYNGKTTTAGVGDGLQSLDYRDCVELVCTVANTAFAVVDSQGTPQSLGDQGYVLSNPSWGSVSPSQALRSVWGYSLAAGTGRWVGTGLNTNKAGGCTLHNSSYAWSLGGSTTLPGSWNGSNGIDRMVFGSEAMSTLSATLANSFNAGAGMEFNSSLGKSYRYAPWTGAADNGTSTVTRFTWSTETPVETSSSAPRGTRGGGVLKSGTICYVGGSDAGGTMIDKFVGSTEAVTATVTSMDVGMNAAVGGNAATKGYMLAGNIAGTNPSNRVGALNFSNETYATLGNILTYARNYPAHFNTSVKTVMAGGSDSTGTTPTNVVQVFTYSTETSAAATAISGQTVHDFWNAGSTQSGGYL